MDWPSGENTGLEMLAFAASPETMTRGLGSDTERTYSFTFATYATLVPSLEIATSWRPMLVKVSPWPSGIEKRATIGRGGRGHSIQATSAVSAAAIAAPAVSIATARARAPFQRAGALAGGLDRPTSAVGSLSRNSGVLISANRWRRSFARHFINT